MKLFLLFIIFLLSILIAFKFIEKVKIKVQIFESLIIFKNELLCDITLFRSGVIERLEKVDEILKKTFNGAKESLKECKDFVCTDTRLSCSEKELISQFVNALGRSDEDGQKKILSYFGEKFDECYKKYKTHKEVRSGLYLRMGVLIGALVVILLV